MKATRCSLLLVVGGLITLLLCFSSCSRSNDEGERAQDQSTSRIPPVTERALTTEKADGKAWTEASDKNTLDGYKMYLVKHLAGKFRNTAVSKILELLPVKCSVVDGKTFLVTSGWNYRKNMKLGYAQNIVINDIDKGVFTTSGGMAFIPLCMESEESKQKRKVQKESGGFHFEMLSDVIGVTWIFNKRGLVFNVAGCDFIPLVSGATVEFLDNGVRLKGFQMALPSPDGRRVPILTAKFDTIFEAAEAGDLTTVQELIRRDANVVSSTNDKGYTALHIATIEGFTDIVEYLLRNGADINRPTASDKSSRSTPLHCAAYNGQLECVRLLLSKGANIEAKEMNGCTPLHIASYIGHNAVVEFLISKGANLEARDEKNGATPLFWAVAAGKKDVVETIVSKGALVNVKDKNGETPLSLATQAKNQELAALLERHGAKQ